MTIEQDVLKFYRCPATGGQLVFEEGSLVSPNGHRFPVNNGVPYLVWPAALGDAEAATQAAYDRMAEQVYEAALEWQFAAIKEDEDAVRESMVNQLALAPDHRVLEIGCGTGHDSFRIARRLNGAGALFMQDLSPGMVHECVKRMAAYDKEMSFRCRLDFTVSNATHLPYPDNFFDRVFHFGGFNEFGDYRKAAAEFARVVKPGGLVLFGDEAVAPWLRDAEFGRIVVANNPLFAHKIPLEFLPECARTVSVHWIMANCFYLISFIKGDGPPPLDLDLPHKGWRGGTMRSRYFGVLEGVRPETKEMVRIAAASAGLSVYDWLEKTIRANATITPSRGGDQSNG